MSGSSGGLLDCASPSEDSPYDINKYRNPDNAYLDSEGCPRGNDASTVPMTDE